MQLNLQQIEENIVKMVELQTLPVQKKMSFCRYYLKGRCLFDEKDCSLSHGIHDLDYVLWNQEELIQYNYLAANDFNQTKTIKSPNIYKNLYQFQSQKIFTLQELNEERQKRLIIRKQFHKKLFTNFIKLLQHNYPQGKFTQDFLVRQYTRVGFNKLMTKIKLSHLSSFLCNQQDSQYFQISIVMPPHVKYQRTFLVRKAKDEQTDNFYLQAYHNILKDHAQEVIDEGTIKRMLFNYPKKSIHIPPLNIHLKDKKCTFISYLKSLLGQNIVELQVKVEADILTLVESSKKFLEKELSNRFIEWNDVYKFLAKEHHLNNGNIINQVKPYLALQGYRFLFFPMIQFMSHPKIQAKIDYDSFQQCPCNFKNIYSQQELSILNQVIYNEKLLELQSQQSYDVFDIQTLMKYAPSIYNSQILGVDLEGKLRKNGYIQMIQLNNRTNTFLIDIYRMDHNGDVIAFQLTKKLLRNVMINQKILKIFHDCRNDSLALHEFMECCIKNVYDTSASQTYKNQLEIYKKFDQIRIENLDQKVEGYQKKQKKKQSKAKQVIAHVNNVRTPGLNQILNLYNAPHGINKNKQLFHSMWSKGQTSLFDQRPLNPDFRQYCIKDVLDLPHCYYQMTKQAKQKQFDLQLAKWISSQYVKYGYLSTQEGEEKK